MSFGDTSFVGASPQEIAAANQALTDWQGVQKNYTPIAQKNVARAQNAGLQDTMRQGRISSSVGQSLDANQANTNSALMAGGAMPSSGKFLTANLGNGRASGLAKSLAKGVINNESSYLQGMGDVLQSGQGLLRGTNAAQNQLAGLAFTANSRRSDSKNATTEAIAGGIGAGVGMFQSMGGFDTAKANLKQGGKWNNSGGSARTDYTGSAYSSWTANGGGQ